MTEIENAAATARRKRAPREMAERASDNNLTRIGEVPVRTLELHRGLPASRFVEGVAGEEQINVPARDHRSFTAFITGDCMAPDYPDGWCVVFSYEAVDLEGLTEGCGYYVQQNGSGNGGNTFKRLLAAAEDTMTLVCINTAKHPQKLIVPREHVERVAKAVWVGRRTG